MDIQAFVVVPTEEELDNIDSNFSVENVSNTVTVDCANGMERTIRLDGIFTFSNFYTKNIFITLTTGLR